MTTCKDCASAERNPHHGIYMASCLGCKCRMLAHSPAAHASLKAGRVTAELNQAAKRHFGEEHKQHLSTVKAWAERIKAHPSV